MAVYTLDFVKFFKFTSNGTQFSFICWVVATQLGDRIFLLRRSTQQSHSKSRWWKSMLIHQEWFTALFSQQLLDSQSLESPICILQALNMPLIRCTNVFFQGWLSRHITFPSEKTRPESWPGNTWVRQLRSGSCHYPTAANKCNEQPSQATANPAGGKACSSTKGGLLRYIVNTYSIHKVCILQALNMPLICCTNVFFQGILSRQSVIIR